MIKSKFKLVFFLLLNLLLILLFYNFPFNVINAVQNNMVLTTEELNNIVNSSNWLCSSNISSVNAKNKKFSNEICIKFKLFNLFSVKKLRVSVNSSNYVYAGGNSVGFSLDGKGLTIVGSNSVLTPNGEFNPIATSTLKNGDVILEINNIPVNSVKDIGNILKENKNNKLLILFKRNNIIKKTTLVPALDDNSGLYKLGLWVKDNTMGVGTLTFVNPKTLEYGALGHAITDESNNIYDIEKGEIYKSNVVGIKKGKRGVAGEILGLFVQGRNKQGNVKNNNEFGVFGTLNKDNNIIVNNKQYKLGGRMSCKPGKAKILTCVSGTDVEEFDIEIIKTNYQNTANDKSMVIKVVDKELIKKTGGIVQGMSGSPIIQNNKIVGAITHVFVADPLKGFGLYIDWMV